MFSQVLWDCSGQKLAPCGAATALLEAEELGAALLSCSTVVLWGEPGTTSGPHVCSRFTLLWYSCAPAELPQAYSSIPAWSKISLLRVEEPRNYRLQKSLEDEGFNLCCRSEKNT